MERETKHRRILRGLFTKKANELDTLLSTEEQDVAQVHVCLQMLHIKFEELQTVDGKIYDRMLTELEDSEDDLCAEIEACDEYRRRYLELQERCNSESNREGGPKTPLEIGSIVYSASSATGKRKFRLPTIELKKFNDNLKDWLPFWAQFKKIHEDNEIDLNNKIAYLSQATVPGSRARKIVDSFPPVPENYEKIVDSLRSRFGREDLQIEVYVRELLRLVLNKSRSKNCPVAVLYDEIESQLRSLETLGVASDKYAAMLYPLIESCLPESLITVFHRSSERLTRDSGDEETIDTLDARLKGLMKFLRSEVENEQRLTLAVEGFHIKEVNNDTEAYSKRSKLKFEKSGAAIATASGFLNCDVAKCVFCGGSHDNESCFKAQKMTLEQKKEFLTKGRACYRCLKVGHSARKCRTTLKCILYGKSHVTMMCLELPVHKGGGPTKEKPADNSDQVLTNQTSAQVFLQTVSITLVGNNGGKQIRALLDTGSQRSYILQSTAQKMGFKPIGEERIVHTLFGGKTTNEQKHSCYEVKVSGGGYTCSLEVLSQPMICNSVPYMSEGPWLEQLKDMNIVLTDVGNCGPIEMLLGADILGKLYTGCKQELKCGLFAIETLLGWTLMGKIPPAGPRSSVALTVFSLFVQQANITDLWELDVLGITDPTEKRSKEDRAKEIQERFMTTTQEDEQGRYVVKLPWLEDHPPLDSNFSLAKRRLDSTINKLRASQIFEKYNSIFNEWQNEGIIEEVAEPNKKDLVHYLPHRPVVKENSLTTKIRPVFDASAHERGKPSLNQCLDVGPNLITRIPTVLLQFRLQRLGVVADIKKAFLQIALNEEDRDYLRFLWVTEDGQIKVFRHRRVVFGVCSSPFLLGATIELHLARCKRNWTEEKGYTLETIDQLANSFYVDNSLTSVPDRESLYKFMKESRCLMDEAKMDLRGWEFSGADVTVNKIVPVLGLVWDVNDDTLAINEECLSVLQNINEKQVTKRLILSVTQRIFDPIGFSCPVTLVPKLLLQQLWKGRQGWDTPLDGEVAQNFKMWAEDSLQLDKIRIPRWICADREDVSSWSLHIFSDASQRAYSAVIFLRVERQGGTFVYLIAAKARVAPLKELTIPRLELLGATIAARLYESVKEHFGGVPAYFWSDSSTVLSWIKRAEEWSPFVRNRVKEIRSLTDAERWHHVPGAMNPADLPSRGCRVIFLAQKKWWEGPIWLFKDPLDWPKGDYEVDECQVNSEKKKTAMTLFNADSNFWHLNYFGQYAKILRMMAWIKRFCYNARTPSRKLRGELSVEELDEAEVFILKTVQRESFLEGDSRLACLKPFRDDIGLIRLRSQVSQRPDTNDFRFPIVLPGEHSLVKKLIMRMHKDSCHVGTQGLLNLLREKYWILGGRRTLRSVVSQCGVCKRHSSKALKVEPPTLPLDRVRDASAFEITGVDFAGPLFMRDGLKSWVCLFTCAIYRAIHLELVTSLSTSSFIQALRRFIARRGRPSTMYSDNGTNFVGFERACKDLDWTAIEAFSSAQRIQWRFNPPTAAWWGGFWERLIGVVKGLLRKVLGRASLSYEDLTTVLCECESVVNSRPLTYISNNPQELIPLTPVMFLRDRESGELPEADVIERASLCRKAKHRQKLLGDLRRRFRVEYLAQLKPHAKARRQGRDKISLGDVVLIGNDSEKRLNWPLGRIVALLPGKDDQIRLVKLQTARGQVLRPVQRLYPLEGPSDFYPSAASASLPASPPSDLLREVVDDEDSDRAGVIHSRASDIDGDSAEVVYSRVPARDSATTGANETQESAKLGPLVERTRRGRLVKLPTRFK